MGKSIGFVFILSMALLLAACGTAENDAEPGEPTTTYLDQKFTSTPSTEGTYVMQVDKEGMLVVDTMPKDFGSTGGGEDFYNAVIFKYPNAVEELKVGQRVIVEDTGFILESFPGQGGAKHVEVLPEYKPKNATLSESEVIVKAIDMVEKKSEGMVIIRTITFDPALTGSKTPHFKSA